MCLFGWAVSFPASNRAKSDIPEVGSVSSSTRPEVSSPVPSLSSVATSVDQDTEVAEASALQDVEEEKPNAGNEPDGAGDEGSGSVR